jgi:hypothetical protein
MVLLFITDKKLPTTQMSKDGKKWRKHFKVFCRVEYDLIENEGVLVIQNNLKES